MLFAEKIKDLRKENGITQVDLSKKLGVPRSTVANWEQERCEPSLSDLILLAEVFGVTVGYLIGAEDEFGHSAPSDLTEDDKKLLAYYHGMDPTQQRAILRTAESFYVDNQANSKRLS